MTSCAASLDSSGQSWMIRDAFLAAMAISSRASVRLDGRWKRTPPASRHGSSVTRGSNGGSPEQEGRKANRGTPDASGTATDRSPNDASWRRVRNLVEMEWPMRDKDVLVAMGGFAAG